MSNTNDLLNRINAKYSTMSKGHKLLATYITDNYDKAVFLTAAKMGETVGISESTVVRFATSLGYKGYPDFQKALEELVRNKLNSVQRMEVTYGRISQSQILETVLQSDRDKIKTTLEKIDADAFDLAVDTILQSRKIYIVGIRSCAPLASFLAFYMNLMFEDVCLLTTNSSSELFEQMVRIGKEDVIIGISFPRYSMRTLEALEFACPRTAGCDCSISDAPLYPGFCPFLFSLSLLQKRRITEKRGQTSCPLFSRFETGNHQISLLTLAALPVRPRR